MFKLFSKKCIHQSKNLILDNVIENGVTLHYRFSADVDVMSKIIIDKRTSAFIYSVIFI